MLWISGRTCLLTVFESIARKFHKTPHFFFDKARISLQTLIRFARPHIFFPNVKSLVPDFVPSDQAWELDEVDMDMKSYPPYLTL